MGRFEWLPVELVELVDVECGGDFELKSVLLANRTRTQEGNDRLADSQIY